MVFGTRGAATRSLGHEQPGHDPICTGKGSAFRARWPIWELALARLVHTALWRGHPQLPHPRQRVELLWQFPAYPGAGWIRLLTSLGQTQFPHPENGDAASLTRVG